MPMNTAERVENPAEQIKHVKLGEPFSVSISSQLMERLRISGDGEIPIEVEGVGKGHVGFYIDGDVLGYIEEQKPILGPVTLEFTLEANDRRLVLDSAPLSLSISLDDIPEVETNFYRCTVKAGDEEFVADDPSLDVADDEGNTTMMFVGGWRDREGKKWDLLIPRQPKHFEQLQFVINKRSNRVSDRRGFSFS